MDKWENTICYYYYQELEVDTFYYFQCNNLEIKKEKGEIFDKLYRILDTSDCDKEKKELLL